MAIVQSDNKEESLEYTSRSMTQHRSNQKLLSTLMEENIVRRNELSEIKWTLSNKFSDATPSPMEALQMISKELWGYFFLIETKASVAIITLPSPSILMITIFLGAMLKAWSLRSILPKAIVNILLSKSSGSPMAVSMNCFCLSENFKILSAALLDKKA